MSNFLSGPGSLGLLGTLFNQSGGGAAAPAVPAGAPILGALAAGQAAQPKPTDQAASPFETPPAIRRRLLAGGSALSDGPATKLGA